jgi:hypothetical protein
MAGTHFLIGIGIQIGKIGSKKGPEFGIPPEFPEFRSDFPTKVPKHFAYIQYGCWMQSEASCSLNHDITTTSLGLRLTPQNPKSAPHLHRHISVRANSYGHSHYFNVLKHFVYIQYGCGVLSEACCSLNHDITSSLRLRLRSTPPKKETNSPPAQA